MGWFSKWLPSPLSRKRRAAGRARKFRPALAELETRTVPANLSGIASNFVNHGGPVLSSVQVEAVFLGDAWKNDPSLQSTEQQIDSFLQYLVNSPFMDTMGQYGVGRGQFTGSTVLDDPLGSSISTGQIDSLLSQAVQGGTLQAPGSNRLYVVFTPPNVGLTEGRSQLNNVLGYHTSLFDGQNNQHAYAVIPYPGGSNPQETGLSAFQSLTQTTSHELAEAVTDPYVDARGNPSGWDDYNFTPGDSGEGEIADIADALGAPPAYLTNNGQTYAVTELWSNQADNVVAPSSSTATTPPTTTPTASGTLTVTARNVQGATSGQSFTAVVAVANDTFANVTSTDLSATIDWGDKTSPDTNVQVVGPGRDGGFVITGTHTYAAAGQYTITVTINDTANKATASDTSTADVSAPTTAGTLSVTGQNVTAQAGQPFQATVATFTDPGASPYGLVAKIDWGDGSWPSLVRVQGPDAQGNFTVAGWHNYPSAGNYTITVTVFDLRSGAEGSATATADVSAASAVSVTGQRIDATAGKSFTGTVALVSDPGASASDLTATIDWGDGTSAKPDVTSGTVTTDASGHLVVQGTHTYADVGNYPVSVTVTNSKTGDVGKGLSVADVDPAPSLPVRGVDVSATAGQSFTDVIGVVYAPGASASDLKVTVDWGDKTAADSNVQVVPFGTDGKFVLIGTHSYASAGQYTIGVTVTDSANGLAGSSSSTASVAAAPETTTTSPTNTSAPTPTTDPTPATGLTVPPDVPPLVPATGHRRHHTSGSSHRHVSRRHG
jgi:hypothetical protein